MVPNRDIMRAVEQLHYRVTAGDVAAQAGMDLQLAEQGLLTLASEVGGHMQVSETGELAYVFPRGMQGILQGKYFRLRLQKWWSQIWRVLFYLIRVSFGVVLIASLVLIVLTLIIIAIALSAASSQNRDNDRGGGGGFGPVFLPRLWIGPDWFYLFSPGYGRRSYERRQFRGRDGQMSFLESIFSFLFGDGNPNTNLEERRWQAIATTIRNNGGSVVAEQISPYLDNLGNGSSRDLEDYMLPVLSRFNGRPEVSPEGDLIYRFPELQVMAEEHQATPVPAYLKETPWQFSAASSTQKMWAISLGGINLVAALALWRALQDREVVSILAQIMAEAGFAGSVVSFTTGIFGFLLAYGVAFLGIPLARYFWIQWRNKRIEARNEERQERAIALNEADNTVQRKLTYASEFATRTIVSARDLAYTTEEDLTEQELAQKDKIDEDWRRRLESH
ncbi:MULTISPECIES: hypothetical protein [unclassified Leptolyngbya]|uniref:hypothetical protein n=1 Tax=unclassified Leptolyngbya TaxID=2650499 RepID=UPI0016872B3D|nr:MULTISPECIES: hypothetical protein [unclassified Leptolyngbya]MBD1910593.1 hypothetical protein [Leptolyngbya sp. FACHB-8]MBD2154533.1 hypothetical protein [Leptolyngbya sp. FACHB-16]